MDIKEYKKQYYLKNKEKIKTRSKKRYEICIDDIKVKRKEYYQLNKDRFPNRTSEENREHYLKNKDKENKRCRDWKRKNRSLCNAALVKYRMAKLNATPKWADLNKIKGIYINCPTGLEVDHIVPIQGKNVCGLHVEYNLQYLTKSENCKKNNKFLQGKEK